MGGIKFRPKKNVKMKVSHSVVAIGIVAGVKWGGWGGSAGRGLGGFMDSCHVTHDMNFCTFFNLLTFTISNKA